MASSFRAPGEPLVFSASCQPCSPPGKMTVLWHLHSLYTVEVLPESDLEHPHGQEEKGRVPWCATVKAAGEVTSHQSSALSSLTGGHRAEAEAAGLGPLQPCAVALWEVLPPRDVICPGKVLQGSVERQKSR